MKEKIQISLDVTKITKAKVVERKYKNKEGVEVTQKVYKTELVPLKAERFVAEGNSWKLFKTHFIAEIATPEEKAAGIKGKIVGDGLVFRNNAEQGISYGKVIYPAEDINPDDVPF